MFVEMYIISYNNFSAISNFTFKVFIIHDFIYNCLQLSTLFITFVNNFRLEYCK